MTSEEKFIEATDEYILTVCLMKQLVEDRRRNPEIPDSPPLHMQMYRQRENAITAGRACTDQHAKIMTEYLALPGFAGDRLEVLQDKWVTTKIALREVAEKSGPTDGDTPLPESEIRYPEKPNSISTQNHQKLWKAALTLSVDGKWFAQKDLKSTSGVNGDVGSKWCQALHPKYLNKRGENRRDTTWSVI